MIANPNPNLPKRLQWYIVLAALTCVSASPSTVEPKTIFAGSASLKQPLGVVGQSDARVKRYLRRNSDATESMDDENEARGGNLGSAVDQGLAGAIDSVEGGVTSGVSAAIDQGLAAKVGEAGKSDVIFGVSGTNHNPAAKVDESLEAGVISSVSAKVHDPAATVGKAVEKTVKSGARVIHDHFINKFKSLMGDQIEFYIKDGNLFKSDQYTTWSKLVDKLSELKSVGGDDWAKEIKVSTLLSIYGENDVISMLAAGRKDPDTKKIAVELEIVLLSKWDSDGKEDNIMDLLTIGKDKSEVLSEMKRNPYGEFVTQFTKRYSDKKLVELLVVAKAKKKTRSKATKLAEHQLKIWQERGIDVIGSYELLELNKEHPDTLLRNPMLSTWINYVEMLGPDPYEMLILAMRKQVGDKKLDSILAAGGNKLDSILAAAKVDDTNARIRRTLLHMQEKHQSWVRLQEYPQAKKWRKNGKSVGDVLDLLKVQHNGEEMLGTKDWDAWVAYVTFLEKQKQPKDQSETATVIYAMLKNRFSSEGLAKLVATAKTVESTKEIAGKWERSEWHIAQRTPDDVFNLLKLKEKGNAVFESPDFENWALYVIELNSVRSRKDDVELAYQLYRHYGPDVERMLKQSEMTASEKNDEFTKAIAMMLLEVFERKKGLKEKGLVDKRRL
ncbi:hypothetical protein KXD40_009440 [Peronospora effusa]|uniref:RxLR effector protein n=1 Tax=Peronospora effusa TaxID=542832 RepID=A0A3M6VFG4_9STRA|nr:hypothetical protein DD238_007540 [Peronospora effusa]RQM17594.1 hypothetical protein DD237_003136 [Peronospora effusa]UIZ28676.1 hypothetical protein KXD40_009440 [Peronospora effusa]